MFSKSLPIAITGCLMVAGFIFPQCHSRVCGQQPDAERPLELIVVGPDQKPVPNAKVDLRARPAPNEKWVQHGKFVETNSYGASMRTGEDGRLVLLLPQQATHRININITTPGFGPYWAGWSNSPTSEEMPSSFTAILDAGRTMGGVVVDESGAPVKGAQVHPNIHFKKRPGDTSRLGIGNRIITDEHGRWQFESVPANLSDVFVEITHPEYVLARRSLPLEGYGLAAGQTASQPIVLGRGLAVMGRITGPDGQPVSGALVRTKFLNDERETRSGDDGVYLLVGCEPGRAKIVVSAKGLAVARQELEIVPQMPPVNFAMEPGGHVRIRVIDENGKPIAKTRIFFQKWGSSRYQYFELDHVHQYTDENGIWEWNEAPLDHFEADVCPPGGMQLSDQSFIAREEEYVVSPPPLLVISGTVVDAVSKKPIPEFRVVPGIRSSPTYMNWVYDGTEGAFDAADGKFQLTRNRGYMAHLVRIEAPGYLPSQSRDIKSDEGQMTVRFELERGQDIAAQILTSKGQPAIGAKIALGLAGGQISVSNGTIDDGSTYAARKDSDEEGRFAFPPQGTDYQLVITHPSGYAHVRGKAEERLDTIRLIPWARVEGTFRVASQPVSGVNLTLESNGVHSYGKDVASIFTHHDVTTGTGGKFVFDRVFAGEGWISRRILMTVSDGAREVTSAIIHRIKLKSAETTKVEFGLLGRAVVGSLVAPEGTPAGANWSFTLLDVETQLPSPGSPPYPGKAEDDPVAYDLWLQQWNQSDEGKALLQAQQEYEKARSVTPSFRASVGEDGSFRIDDIPAGNYLLRYHARGGPQPNAVVGEVRKPFTVTEPENASDRKVVDLGVLELQPIR